MKVATHHSKRRVNYVREDCTTERGSNQGQLKELVRGSVEETLNGLLEAEAEKLTQAGRYERSEQRQGYRSGHYNRNLMTTAGEVNYSAFATLGTHLGIHFIPIFSEGIFFVLYTKPRLYFALVTAT